MTKDIILIGPMNAGKSTIGEILAKRLGLRQVAMDDVRFDYYKEIGYDHTYAGELSKQNTLKLLDYWKPYEAHAVKRLLEDNTNCVFDFGAGHSFYEDFDLLEQVEQTLHPYPNVILLLPSPDLEESARILNERMIPEMLELPFIEELKNLNRQMVLHPSNHQLAKHTVYTEGLTLEQIADAVLKVVKL